MTGVSSPTAPQFDPDDLFTPRRPTRWPWAAAPSTGWDDTPTGPDRVHRVRGPVLTAAVAALTVLAAAVADLPMVARGRGGLTVTVLTVVAAGAVAGTVHTRTGYVTVALLVTVLCLWDWVTWTAPAVLAAAAVTGLIARRERA